MRTPTLTRPLKAVRHTAALAVIVALAGCAGEPTTASPEVAEDTTDTTTDNTTTDLDPTTDEPAAEPADEPAADDAPSTEDRGSIDDLWQGVGLDLEPGVYSAALLDDLTITVPPGTRLVFLGEDYMTLRRASSGDEDDLVVVLRPLGVIPPNDVGRHIAHGVEPAEAAIAVPDDLTSYFDAIPQLETTASGTGDNGAGGYRWWDVRLRPELGETFSDCGTPACIGMFASLVGVTVQRAEWFTRVAQPIEAPHLVLWSQEEEDGPVRALLDDLVDGMSRP